MPTLSQYITSARRLLHDSTGNYWSDSELTDYINDARFRIVCDTGCYRVLQSVNTVIGQETYSFPTPTGTKGAIDILNITLLWGSMRVPMNYMPFTEFNLKLRTWQSFQSRPTVFSVYGQNTVYVGPVPDQVYAMEWDCIAPPSDLVLGTDSDTILQPFTVPIPYYAAHLAKFKEQSYEESDKFKAEYTARAMQAARSSVTRRIPSVYSRT